ncbi:aldehyde dehydrogenase family protein [Nocardioides nanhaiensis]|uniref:NAD-dependent succinate-semialdehyde dehydrogenase n=1 Tax=Nocardioides nanhaiensis TaxID=1476871 RepID=A0ABP8VVB6_9ACTN
MRPTTTPDGIAALVAGDLVASPERTWSTVLHPHDGAVVARVGAASTADVEACVQAAGRAAEGWRAVPAGERARALRALAADLRAAAETLATLIVAESGKLRAEALAEVDLSCRYLEWFASITPDGEPRQTTPAARVALTPVGVVAAVTPWNFPLSIPVRKIAAALAAGCPVVLKPSPLAPATAVDLVLRCQQHLPPGVVGLVLGGREEGLALAGSAGVRAVSFTGSTEAGVHLATRLAATLTRSVLELGGRAPAIVLPGSDLERAADTLMVAKFRNNGASCIAANNVFVHESQLEPLIDVLADRVQALQSGDPDDAATTLGPQRTPEHARTIAGLAAQAERGGCRVVRSAPVDEDSGCHTPAALVHADREIESWEREVFGPLLQVRGFRDVDRVVQEVNEWQRGLGGYVVAPEQEHATALARRLRIGIVGIDTGTPNSPEVPFGGFDLAGWGREGSMPGLEAFLEHQTLAYGPPVTGDDHG